MSYKEYQKREREISKSFRKGDKVKTPNGRGTVIGKVHGKPFPTGTVRITVKLDNKRGEFSKILFAPSELRKSVESY